MNQYLGQQHPQGEIRFGGRCEKHLRAKPCDLCAAEYTPDRADEPARQTTAAQSNSGIPLPLLERLSKTLTNLGYATPEGGMEAFGATIETQLYRLCAGVDDLLAKDMTAQQAARLSAAKP